MEGVFTHSDKAPRTECYNLQRTGIPHPRKGIFCCQLGWYFLLTPSVMISKYVGDDPLSFFQVGGGVRIFRAS